MHRCYTCHDGILVPWWHQYRLMIQGSSLPCIKISVVTGALALWKNNMCWPPLSESGIQPSDTSVRFLSLCSASAVCAKQQSRHADHAVWKSMSPARKLLPFRTTSYHNLMLHLQALQGVWKWLHSVLRLLKSIHLTNTQWTFARSVNCDCKKQSHDQYVLLRFRRLTVAHVMFTCSKLDPPPPPTSLSRSYKIRFELTLLTFLSLLALRCSHKQKKGVLDSSWKWSEAPLQQRLSAFILSPVNHALSDDVLTSLSLAKQQKSYQRDIRVLEHASNHKIVLQALTQVYIHIFWATRLEYCIRVTAIDSRFDHDMLKLHTCARICWNDLSLWSTHVYLLLKHMLWPRHCLGLPRQAYM